MVRTRGVRTHAAYPTVAVASAPWRAFLASLGLAHLRSATFCPPQLHAPHFPLNTASNSRALARRPGGAPPPDTLVGQDRRRGSHPAEERLPLQGFPRRHISLSPLQATG